MHSAIHVGVYLFGLCTDTQWNHVLLTLTVGEYRFRFGYWFCTLPRTDVDSQATVVLVHTAKIQNTYLQQLQIAQYP